MLDNDLLKQQEGEEQQMKKLIAGVLVLSAAFTALMGEADALANYPWCIIGYHRSVDCYFSTRDQCAAEGRTLGFGRRCIQNPFYNPALPSVMDGASPVKGPNQGRHKSHRHEE
jgi:hypothetical protein